VPDDPWSAFPRDFIPSRNTAVSWLLGLGSNRKAPAGVLIRLLDAELAWILYRRDLPSEVIDAAVAHPSKRIWMTAAEELDLSRRRCSWTCGPGGAAACRYRTGLAAIRIGSSANSVITVSCLAIGARC
jgi:hypothetical protein